MKKLFFLLFVGILAFSLSGCGTMERLLQTDSTGSFGGVLKNTTASVADPPAVTVPSGETSKVTLYFADATGVKLVREPRQISKTLSLARETLNELFKGPGAGSKLLAVVPEGTVLLDINLKDATAIVDISKEILQPMDKVAAATSVEAIVDTLTQFPTVQQVKFRVEGETVDKIGDVSTSGALTPEVASGLQHPITQQPVAGENASAATGN
ncbi:MAG: GerMN domain-containing protein [Peptococcaceae bacterium]|nr:GerMN domain-containing protein [Peptococcaceae bacterium]